MVIVRLTNWHVLAWCLVNKFWNLVGQGLNEQRWLVPADSFDISWLKSDVASSARLFYLSTLLTGCCLYRGMREWLKMSGTPNSSLDTLENKLRTLHLSEAQIRNSLTEPILKAILPGSVGIKLKTCIGEKAQPVVILVAHAYVFF